MKAIRKISLLILLIISYSCYSQNGRLYLIVEKDTIDNYDNLNVFFMLKDGDIQQFNDSQFLDYKTPVDFDNVESLAVLYEDYALNFLEDEDFTATDTIETPDKEISGMTIPGLRYPVFQQAYWNNQDMYFHLYTPTFADANNPNYPPYLKEQIMQENKQKKGNIMATLTYHLPFTIIINRRE